MALFVCMFWSLTDIDDKQSDLAWIYYKINWIDLIWLHYKSISKQKFQQKKGIEIILTFLFFFQILIIIIQISHLLSNILQKSNYLSILIHSTIYYFDLKKIYCIYEYIFLLEFIGFIFVFPVFYQYFFHFSIVFFWFCLIMISWQQYEKKNK